jgi:competence protein ComFB
VKARVESAHGAPIEKFSIGRYHNCMQKLHNIMEDIVQTEIEEVCAEIAKGNLDDGICTCEQCKLDAACYVLNRVKPQYLLSNRGLVREEHSTLEKLQRQADVGGLVLQALKLVGQNKREESSHDGTVRDEKSAEKTGKAIFNIPIIVGRLFNGQNFEPMSGIEVELFYDSALIPMKNNNWQNPCFISPQMLGTYTFWTQGIAAKKVGEHQIFDFLLRVEVPSLETLIHRFSVPVISEERNAESFSVERKFKVIDLYLFPPETE